MNLLCAFENTAWADAGTQVGEASGAVVEVAKHGGETSQWLFLGFSAFVFVSAVIVSVLGTRKLRLVPQGFQNVLEFFVEKACGIPEMVMGPRGAEYAPFVGTFFLYILFMNLSGLIPAFKSGTASLSVTLGLGLTAIAGVQYYGFRAHGVKYLLHFLGPVPAMALLFLPIELISEMVRPLSLSMRLYGNISGEEKMLEAFVTNLGTSGLFVAAAVMLPLQILTGVLQALVFSLLVSIYIALATEKYSEHSAANHTPAR